MERRALTVLCVALVCTCVLLSLSGSADAKGGKGGRGGKGGGKGGGANKGNTGTLSEPSKAEIKEMRKLLEQWKDDGSFTRGKIKTSYKQGQLRLDSQGHDSGHPFDRYAVQKDTRSFAVVHIQRDHHFPADLIRRAFEESAKHQAHVFLTAHNIDKIPVPSDGKHYDHHDLHDDMRVWSVAGVLHSLHD